MKVYICTVCGFSYDKESAEQDTAGEPIPFSQLETDWVCPNCGISPDLFNPAPSDEENDENTF